MSEKQFPCEYCNGMYKSRGLKNHQNSCKSKTTSNIVINNNTTVTATVKPIIRADSSRTKKLIFDTWCGSGERIGTCHCCHINKFDCMTGDWNIGHIVSQKKGGSDHVDNLRPLCGDCNREMFDEYMLDYMNRKGFVISDDLKEADNKNDVKNAFILLRNSYDKLLVLPMDNPECKPHISGLLESIKLLSKIAIDSDFHSIHLGFLFKYDVISENRGSKIIDDYQKEMDGRPDLESFKRITAALHTALDPCTKLTGHNIMIQEVQIKYMNYKIRFSKYKYARDALIKTIKHDFKKGKIPYIDCIKNTNTLALEGLPKSDATYEIRVKKAKQAKNIGFFDKVKGVVESLGSSDQSNDELQVANATYTTDDIYAVAFDLMVPYFSI